MKTGGKNDGAFGMLHKLTPVRMLFIRQALSNFLERDTELSKLLQVCGFWMLGAGEGY